MSDRQAQVKGEIISPLNPDVIVLHAETADGRPLMFSMPAAIQISAEERARVFERYLIEAWVLLHDIEKAVTSQHPPIQQAGRVRYLLEQAGRL